MTDVLFEAMQPQFTRLVVRKARLPRWAPALTAVVALAGASLAGLGLGWSPIAIVVCAAAVHVVVLPAWSRVVENRRAAVDRLATSLVWVALGVALVPLVSLLQQVVALGAREIDGEFLTWSMRNVVGSGGGIYHAVVGTVLITLAATAISVPLGLLSAVYLVEYGGTSRVASGLRFLVDVMTGIPSIVAGLFAYAMFALLLGPGVHLGIGGAVALSLLMVPIVVRSAEEMLKLVPVELREASYALGVPKWRTIWHVVLPAARSGVLTGVTLAIARVVGETAPLLIIAGATDSVNTNLFNGQMESLPVFIYYSYTQPGLHPEHAQGHAWGAALVLIAIVVLLNLAARLLGRLPALRSPRRR
jgi:phosphate transport system permease protein